MAQNDSEIRDILQHLQTATDGEYDIDEIKLAEKALTAYKDKAVEEVLDRLRLDDDEEYISVGELNLMLDAERYRLKGEK